MPTPQPASRPATVRQGDRDKAYRPLPPAARRAAFEAGLAHYAAGEPFEAHEALEPAWMGTDDLAERALHQGLIKVAAAYVHAGRGNAAGIAKNLAGARGHLAIAAAAGLGGTWGLDLEGLLADVDARLGELEGVLGLGRGGPSAAGVPSPDTVPSLADTVPSPDTVPSLAATAPVIRRIPRA